MKTQTFIFYGQVGSGKGTQVNLLTKYLKNKDSKEVIYAGTGEMFRNLVKNESYTTKIVKEKLEQGELLPDFLTTALFANALVNSLSEEKHLITDGYPRTVVQSSDFEKMMQFFKRDNVKIIYIELSEEEAMKRNLARGRADDTEEGLRRRFNEYKNNVVPSMKYFEEKKGYEVLHINGEQTIEKVHEDIIKALNF